MRKLKLLSSVGLVLAASLLMGQVPSTQPPYNVDTGALITHVLATAATVTGTQQTNLDKVGAICSLNLTTSSGSASVQFTIQGYDSASGQYYTLVDSGSLLARSLTVNTAYSIAVQSGNQTSSLPGNVKVSSSLPLPRLWRVQNIISGSQGPAVSGTIGCQLAR